MSNSPQQSSRADRDSSSSSRSSDGFSLDILGTESYAADDAEKKRMARARLRIEFLNTLFKMTGKQCDIRFERTDGPTQSAIFAGSDLQFENIAVQHLQTAIGVQPNAILRRTDIESITLHI